MSKLAVGRIHCRIQWWAPGDKQLGVKEAAHII